MVVRVEATSTGANTVGIVKICLLEVKKREFLSNLICSFVAVNNGGLKQYCSIIG